MDHCKKEKKKEIEKILLKKIKKRCLSQKGWNQMNLKELSTKIVLSVITVH